uniref:RAP domain-containing protein n=1 Tax=Labrus bergylta TaxID=56723 RepID=A0A3Q3N4T0_9LABR
MKSIACFSSSVRAACQHTSACFPLNRAPLLCTHLDRRSNMDTTVEHLRATPLRSFHSTHVNTAVVQQVSAAPSSTSVPSPWKRGDEPTVQQLGRRVPKPAARPAPHLPPHSPRANPQSNAAARVNMQALFEGDGIPELCSRLADLPSNDRAEGLATLLGACVEFDLSADSPLVLRLMNECLQLLSHRDLGVAQLCHLGEVSYSLEGHKSAALTEVLDSVGVAVEENVATPGEAVRVYSLLAQCYDPSSPRQMFMLSTLNRHTQRMVHWLKATQVSMILQSLLKLQHRQAITLVLRLCHRASQVFQAFSDEEVIKVLSALMIFGQHDVKLLAAMEKDLPGWNAFCDPELLSTVMEYCMQMRCRSEPIFEAVAENFVCQAEQHSTLQIAKQIVAMGRLNYLPQVRALHNKLESILSTRFSQFQPRSLIEVLHACIHLERFPLNYMSKIFSPFFPTKTARCVYAAWSLSQFYQVFHYFLAPDCLTPLHVKKFSSEDWAFETPVESLFYRRIKGPLILLLGGKLYSSRILTPSGYTISSMTLSPVFPTCPVMSCANTRHLLGKEATKRRHLCRMGYEVVQIPYFDFERMRTRKEQVKYLHNKIFPTIFKFSHQSQ